MWNKNPFIELCKIRFPIIQAPMAGISPPRLVAAVSNAGGLGSLGAAYLSPDEIRRAIKEIRELSEAPFAVNLFAPTSSEKNNKQIQNASDFLAPYRKELEIPPHKIDFSSLPSFSEQVDVLLEEKVPIFSFTFGIPSLTILQRMKKQKTLLIGTAATIDEALLLEKSGVDAIVAQGVEAGGHRATFLDEENDPLFTTATLVSQLQGSVKVPIIASGGIMHGPGIAAALALGASAVQMGTAFIACPESGASSAYKKALTQTSRAKTVLTRVVSGRTARLMQNKMIKEMIEADAPIAPFPYQHYLTKEIRIAAEKMHRSDLMALYAGQNYALSTHFSASRLISHLVEQTIDAILEMADQLPSQTEEPQ